MQQPGKSLKTNVHSSSLRFNKKEKIINHVNKFLTNYLNEMINEEMKVIFDFTFSYLF